MSWPRAGRRRCTGARSELRRRTRLRSAGTVRGGRLGGWFPWFVTRLLARMAGAICIPILLVSSCGRTFDYPRQPPVPAHAKVVAAASGSDDDDPMRGREVVVDLGTAALQTLSSSIGSGFPEVPVGWTKHRAKQATLSASSTVNRLTTTSSWKSSPIGARADTQPRGDSWCGRVGFMSAATRTRFPRTAVSSHWSGSLSRHD